MTHSDTAEARNSFDVLREMSEKNMDIQLAPLTNIISADMRGSHGEIKIGVSADIILRMAKGDKFIGGLVLANKEQFDSLSSSPSS